MKEREIFLWSISASIVTIDKKWKILYWKWWYALEYSVDFKYKQLCQRRFLYLAHNINKIN